MYVIESIGLNMAESAMLPDTSYEEIEREEPLPYSFSQSATANKNPLQGNMQSPSLGSRNRCRCLPSFIIIQSIWGKIYEGRFKIISTAVTFNWNRLLLLISKNITNTIRCNLIILPRIDKISTFICRGLISDLEWNIIKRLIIDSFHHNILCMQWFYWIDILKRKKERERERGGWKKTGGSALLMIQHKYFLVIKRPGRWK